MKLKVKFVIYNAISKALIIAAFGLLLPVLVERVVYTHIDKRLEARKDLLLKKIELGGLDQALLEEDCSFDDYNIFKEEFISIQPIYTPKSDTSLAETINNEQWSIENASQQVHRVIRKPFFYDNQWYELNIGEGISTIDQLKNTITRFSMLTMIIVIILSIFVDTGFVQVLLRPFHTIVSRKLRSASDPSVFDFTPVKTSTYEFSYLDESINQMKRKIQDAFAIEREFISNVSHELLTPISILQTRLENMVADEKTPVDISKKIIESQKTLARLSRIVKSLLMISKIENEQYVKNESALIRVMVAETMEELEDRWQQKNITVEQKLQYDFNFSPCNRSLIHTMLFNIVNNAIKYNKENGIITLGDRMNDSEYVLEISDSGIGIDSSKITQMFDRFKRFEKEDENSYGLGLPIVKTIAAFHKIKISVDSAPGEGTQFRLHFPVAAA